MTLAQAGPVPVPMGSYPQCHTRTRTHGIGPVPVNMTWTHAGPIPVPVPMVPDPYPCPYLWSRIGIHTRTHGLGPTPRILDILILQDKTLFGALEAGNIVCWLVNQPIAKLDLFKSPDCRWICKTYVEYCYRNSATVRRLVQSPTLQSTIFCCVHSDLRGKGIRVSPACPYQYPYPHLKSAFKQNLFEKWAFAANRFFLPRTMSLMMPCRPCSRCPIS